nr:L10-interacting MYB domain-containing protein-like [Tanacetum cinerariifolium]
MGVNLTLGAITPIMTDKCSSTDLKPVVQVTNILSGRIRISTNKEKQYYRKVVVSDGSSSHFGCIADDICISNKLQNGSIVQLTKFHFTNFSTYGDIREILVLDLIVLHSKCDIIGDPKRLPDIDSHLNENIDDSRHHVEEPPTSKQNPSTSTQKCSPHSLTQNNMNKIMGVNLTLGAITPIMTDKCSSTDLKPVVQVTNILSGRIRISTNKEKQYYRKVVVSDGSSSHFGCIADDICISNKLQNGSIVQLTKFHFTNFSTYGDIRKQKHQSSNENPESVTNDDDDNSHNAQEPSATTQKYSSHTLTQSKKRKHQSSNHNISKVVEDFTKRTKMISENNKEDNVDAWYKKLESLEEDVSKLTITMMDKNKEDVLGFKKLEILEDVSKLTRMMMEKNKEDDMGACIEKLDKMGAEEPIYDTALLLFCQSADYRKLWLHLKPESCGRWVKNAGMVIHELWETKVHNGVNDKESLIGAGVNDKESLIGAEWWDDNQPLATRVDHIFVHCVEAWRTRNWKTSSWPLIPCCWRGRKGFTHWLKGVEWSCEDAGGNGGKKNSSCATVVCNWGRRKSFGRVGSVSPWSWEGLTLLVQGGISLIILANLALEAQNQACEQSMVEAEKDLKKMIDHISKTHDTMGASYMNVKAEAQAQATRFRAFAISSLALLGVLVDK